MIKEDNKYVYIDNKKTLEKFRKLDCSELGSSSTIYEYNKEEILKVFDYKKSISELNKIEFMKELALNSFIMPNKFLFLDEDYYGYKMNYIKGDLLIETKAKGGESRALQFG